MRFPLLCAQRRAGYWDWEVGVGVSGKEGGVSDGGGGGRGDMNKHDIHEKRNRKTSAASMLG